MKCGNYYTLWYRQIDCLLHGNCLLDGSRTRTLGVTILAKFLCMRLVRYHRGSHISTVGNYTI